jgi:hypothetical protein
VRAEDDERNARNRIAKKIEDKKRPPLALTVSQKEPDSFEANAEKLGRQL